MTPRLFGVSLAALAVLVGACSSSSSSGGPACANEAKLGDTCTGAPSQVCDGDVCTSNVSCTSVTKVSSDAELQSAAGSAQPGSCIALAAGSYGDAKIAGGVSLLGRGASSVKIGHVTIGAGGSSTLRGLAIGGGVEVAASGGAVLDSDKIAGDRDGVSAGAGATVDIESTEIAGTGRYGVSAVDAKSVSLTSVWIHGAHAPGLWAECSTAAGCGCMTATMKDVLFDANLVVGVALTSVNASMDHVEIRNNGVAPDFTGGGGMSVARCSSLDAKRVSVHDNTSYGVLVDASSATLGGGDKTQGFDVSKNLMGVWIQNLPSDGSRPVTLQNASLSSNSAVGVAFSGKSAGITIHASEVSGTTTRTIPTFSQGAAASKEVGDGLVWLDTSQAKIDGLTLRGNARASLLIDGSVGAGSRIDSLVQTAGDDAKGIVQQNFPVGGVSPELGGGLPAPQKISSEQFAVPAAPRLPAPQ